MDAPSTSCSACPVGELTKAEGVELDTFLQGMHALRTRELAEGAQARLDAERSDR